ncbi:MAG: hypothetical protein DMG05_21135 [Acidobacteria bacterium]|nr:MAG: hypothetical protein DMG05_21135 [Acidobacteriota bacterium]
MKIDDRKLLSLLDSLTCIRSLFLSLLRLNQRVDGLPEMESSEQECNFFVAPDQAVLFFKGGETLLNYFDDRSS